jgi:16S rRNA (guanine527-N7)-methyltransferase
VTGIESVRALISSGLSELSGAPAPPGALAQLAELAVLVADWGERINLTGHRDAETVARRLVLDAAALQAALPRVYTVADLGSGAGFPGLPIAILEPDARVVLVEARERRHHFQRHAIRSLGLSNVSAIRGRLEEVEPSPSALVIAQAVAPPERLVPWMLRWASPGGLLAVPGGTSPREARAAVGLERQESQSYQVPLEGPSRTVWTAKVA